MQQSSGDFDSQAFQEQLVDEGQEPTVNSKSISEPHVKQDVSFYLGRMYTFINKEWNTMKDNIVQISGDVWWIRRTQLKIQTEMGKIIPSPRLLACPQEAVPLKAPNLHHLTDRYPFSISILNIMTCSRYQTNHLISISSIIHIYHLTRTAEWIQEINSIS